LRSWKVSPSGALTYVNNIAPGGGQVFQSIWGDGTFVIAGFAGGGGGMHSYSVTNGNWSYLNTTSHYGFKIHGDGTYIYTVGTGQLKSLSIGGLGVFTLLDTVTPSAGSPWDVWSDGSYVYTVDGPYLRVYSVDGAGLLTFVTQNVVNIANQYRSVWGDGTFIYATGNMHAASQCGLRSFSFDPSGGTLTFIDTHNNWNGQAGADYRDVWGYPVPPESHRPGGTYVFCAVEDE